jgi:four helix bundle protein
MEKVKSYRDLQVWSLALELVKDIYKVTMAFPREEKFGLVMQMRRAAVSVSSNIAEGGSRRNTRELIQFLYIAIGSISELETQIEISAMLGFIQDPQLLIGKADRMKKMLYGLAGSLKRRNVD